MKEEQLQFLSLVAQLPARLTVEQAAWMLAFQPHDIGILMTERLLKPLGTPRANTTKYFAAVEIAEYARDPAWLARATNAIQKHWQRKNHTGTH